VATGTEPSTDGIDGAAAGRPVAVAPYDHDVAVTRRKILVVEDEATIVAPLAAALEREGFEPHVAGTVADAIETAGRLDPDLVLLDLMLPDGSGFDVCRELRKRSEVPVIMLTARGDEADRVVGLELGADDYVVKPFSAREVIARVRAVLRRSEARPSPESLGVIEIDGLRLDSERRTVELDSAPVELSRREYDLLERLMRDAGSVITREALIEDVWDMNWFGSTKTLDVHISSLRRKLGDSANTPRFVHTVRGVGFRFSAPGESSSA